MSQEKKQNTNSLVNISNPIKDLIADLKKIDINILIPENIDLLFGKIINLIFDQINLINNEEKLLSGINLLKQYIQKEIFFRFEMTLAEDLVDILTPIKKSCIELIAHDNYQKN